LAWVVSKMNSFFRAFLNSLLVVMVVVVFTQVFFRFVVERPLPWSEEVARYIMVWLTFLGAALAVEKRAHAVVEMFVKWFPRPVRVGMALLAMAASCLFYGLMTYYGARLITHSMTQFSPVLQLPMGYVYVVIPLSGVMLLLNTLVQAHELLVNRKGEGN